MVVPAGRLGLVLRAMTESHPYEEVAYDIFQTEEFLDDRHIFWLGDLERPITLKTLAERTAKSLSAPFVRFIGQAGKKVQKIVLCSGGGKSLLAIAQSTRADVFLTGDLDYHSGREAEAMDLAVIDGGHFHTEKFFGDLITGQLRKSKRLKGLKFLVIRKEKSPFQYAGPRG
jgi:putative NIF3 family GTP cyclohydrolase 1 type 2